MGRLEFKNMPPYVLIHKGKYVHDNCCGVLESNGWINIYADVDFQVYKCTKCDEIFDEGCWENYTRVELNEFGLRKTS